MRANNAKHISPGHLLSRRAKTNSSVRSVSILASGLEAIQGFVDSSWPAVTPKVLEWGYSLRRPRVAPACFLLLVSATTICVPLVAPASLRRLSLLLQGVQLRTLGYYQQWHIMGHTFLRYLHQQIWLANQLLMPCRLSVEPVAPLGGAITFNDAGVCSVHPPVSGPRRCMVSPRPRPTASAARYVQ